MRDRHTCCWSLQEQCPPHGPRSPCGWHGTVYSVVTCVVHLYFSLMYQTEINTHCSSPEVSLPWLMRFPSQLRLILGGLYTNVHKTRVETLIFKCCTSNVDRGWSPSQHWCKVQGGAAGGIRGGSVLWYPHNSRGDDGGGWDSLVSRGKSCRSRMSNLFSSWMSWVGGEWEEHFPVFLWAPTRDQCSGESDEVAKEQIQNGGWYRSYMYITIGNSYV